jgi:hypothetical protein
MQVEQLLNNEFHELSDLFTGFYKEFNVRFFAGSLPACDVKIFHNVPLPKPLLEESVCRNHIREGWLAFAYNRWPEFMIADLLRAMAQIWTSERMALGGKMNWQDSAGWELPHTRKYVDCGVSDGNIGLLRHVFRVEDWT